MDHGYAKRAIRVLEEAELVFPVFAEGEARLVWGEHQQYLLF
jgi:hypothetical protein